MAEIQELYFSIGKKKQSALATPLVAADMFTLGQTNQDIWLINPQVEDNAEDMGKGGPFATQQFKTALDGGGPWNGYMTTEALAVLGAFGIGLDSEAPAGTGYKYTCKPAVSFVDGDRPVTTVLQTMRQGANDIFDHALIGVALDSFELTLNTGVGRQNAQFSSTWIGTGRYVKPSTITAPAATTEHLLNAGGATAITVNGVNYLTGALFVSMRFRYSNNIRGDYGYHPGSGTQSGFQVRGRIRRGRPVVEFEIAAEYQDGSVELDNVISQTEGTATITVDGAQIGAGPDKNNLNLVLHRIVGRPIVSEPQDGIVAVRCPFAVLEHNSNGVLTMEVITETTGIGSVAV